MPNTMQFRETGIPTPNQIREYIRHRNDDFNNTESLADKKDRLARNYRVPLSVIELVDQSLLPDQDLEEILAFLEKRKSLPRASEDDILKGLAVYERIRLAAQYGIKLQILDIIEKRLKILEDREEIRHPENFPAAILRLHQVGKLGLITSQTAPTLLREVFGTINT